ncbi:MAG: hypothetical protein JKY41_15495 [Rhodobacteraceae bacterium]|nr:hypothetical protein [Paracoccaceae bacterium]
MMWNKARLSVFMGKNSNGTPKKKPFFWTPKETEIDIRGRFDEAKDNDHGRAVLTIEDDTDPDKSVVIVLFGDRIVIQGANGPVSVLKTENFR